MLAEKKISIRNFSAKNIIGEDISLARYRNKVILIVNLASLCGYTNQYAGLVELYRRYKGKGLVILGFPSNDFNQEPGNESEIMEFCQAEYNVTFDVFAKISVKGENIHPIYGFLTAEQPAVKWNFEKFLIGKDGQLSKRFLSAVAPLNEKITAAIEYELAK
ncbi:glutathione peroxidase [Ignavibacteria bacterium]|jgi:glutathione peroxidase